MQKTRNGMLLDTEPDSRCGDQQTANSKQPYPDVFDLMDEGQYFAGE
ncbi:hypothetical protein [Motilimonas sp. E26]|nr:hypothetical protein [Motilimonas sp. E26]MCE0559412.1 hypothetical protein [Motilimonas sp. E26]